MVKLTGVLNRFSERKILVAGDFMLDTYTIGKAKRISPEAPVAVIHVQKEEHRPGGAGNVILNLVSLGAQVVVLGRIGDDASGLFLKDHFIQEGVDTKGLVLQKSYKTPVKNRVIADNQQIVRIDHEEIVPLPEALEQDICDKLPLWLEGVELVAISDYGKGFLTDTLLAALIDCARLAGIPVISDPKGIEFAKYSGSTIIKPNLSEAYAAANLPLTAPLDQVAEKVLKASNADVLMITRSEEGISLFYKEGRREDFPVRIREVKDVTGAGDTVLAVLATALANGLSLAEAAQISNVAAGIAIERLGCARVTLNDLARRLLEFDVVNKVFSEEHTFALQKALEKKNRRLLSVSGSDGLTSAIFSTIQDLSQGHDSELLVFVRDSQPDEKFINILAALHNVDFILVHSGGIRHLCEQLDPAEVYSYENNRLEKVALIPC